MNNTEIVKKWGDILKANKSGEMPNEKITLSKELFEEYVADCGGRDEKVQTLFSFNNIPVVPQA